MFCRCSPPFLLQSNKPMIYRNLMVESWSFVYRVPYRYSLSTIYYVCSLPPLLPLPLFYTIWTVPLCGLEREALPLSLSFLSFQTPSLRSLPWSRVEVPEGRKGHNGRGTESKRRRRRRVGILPRNSFLGMEDEQRKRNHCLLAREQAFIDSKGD